jgi:TonB family protein
MWALVRCARNLKESVLKGLNFTPVFLVSFILVGCQSTSSQVISEYNQLVKYESRCDITKKESSITSTPLTRVAPKMPKAAIKSRTQGYVKMEFDISENGKPTRINIVESYPNSLFNQVSVTALSKWVYKPKAVQCNSLQLDYAFN